MNGSNFLEQLTTFSKQIGLNDPLVNLTPNVVFDIVPLVLSTCSSKKLSFQAAFRMSSVHDWTVRSVHHLQLCGLQLRLRALGKPELPILRSTSPR